MTPTDPNGPVPADTEPVDTSGSTPRRVLRATIWLPGLAVGLGAAVATAHGLFEVARAAGAPPLIAALYPLITDGLALVAYATTTRLLGPGRRYAWGVVVLAAGLSGLAQASYLAGGVQVAPAALRFGVGAWPAIAAAIVAHLLFLLATERPDVVQRPTPAEVSSVQPDAVQPPPPSGAAAAPTASTELEDAAPSKPDASPGARAHDAARGHRERHGSLPTARQLAALAEVSRGTAAAALKALRAEPSGLHLVPTHPDEESQP